MDKQIAARVRQAIEKKAFPGCVVGVVKRDGARSVSAFGSLTYAADAEPVSERTVYDLASVTKSIPLASLALTLAAEGRLRLDDTATSFVPELQNDHGATIEDLLRYRVHGAQLSKLPHRTFEEIRTHALERGFDGPPGEEVYTNLPAFILGMVIERAAGKGLAPLADSYFFEPFSMHDTTFFPSKSNCAPTEIDARGEVRGLPHDESAYLFAMRRRAVGHAGLFSTASDLLNFLEAILTGKVPAIVEGARAGLGWQTSGDVLGSRPEGRFGKTGFTGCSVACDVERGIGLVILSNRTYPKRPPDGTAINMLRRDIADGVFG